MAAHKSKYCFIYMKISGKFVYTGFLGCRFRIRCQISKFKIAIRIFDKVPIFMKTSVWRFSGCCESVVRFFFPRICFGAGSFSAICLYILFTTTMSLVKFAAAAAFYPHCIAFARGHGETAENLCRYSRSFPLRLDLRNRYFDYEHQPSEFNLPLITVRCTS